MEYYYLIKCVHKKRGYKKSVIFIEKADVDVFIEKHKYNFDMKVQKCLMI